MKDDKPAWLAHVTYMTSSGQTTTSQIPYNKITWSPSHVIFHGTDDNEIVALNAARVYEIVTEPPETMSVPAVSADEALVSRQLPVATEPDAKSLQWVDMMLSFLSNKSSKHNYKKPL
jgi:hypothetical protein